MARIYRSADRKELKGRNLSAPGTVQGVNTRASADRQQQAFTRQLSRAGEFRTQSSKQAIEGAAQNYAESSRSQLQSMQRAQEFTNQTNAQALKQQGEQFFSNQQLRTRQFLDSEKLTLSQQQESQNLKARQYAQVAEQNAVVKARNLEAFSQISKTAERVGNEIFEKYKEDQIQIGLAIALQEGFNVSDEDREQLSIGEELLNNAAISESYSNESLSEVDLELAETERVGSRTLKGWQAYGYAKGLAQKTAGQWQVAMQEYVDSTEPILPDPENPGQFVSPSELMARSPAAARAVLTAGTVELASKFGVNQINPAILNEFLHPQVNATNNAILANKLSQNRTRNREDAKYELIQGIPLTINSVAIGDLDGTSAYLNDQVQRLLVVDPGLTRGEANQLVLQAAIEGAVASNDVDRLATLAASPLNRERFGDLTWENNPATMQMFEQASDRIARNMELAEKDRLQQIDDMASIAEKRHSDALLQAVGDEAATAAANKAYEDELTQLASQGSESAFRKLQELRTRSETTNPFTFRAIMRQWQEHKELPSAEAVERAIATGQLTAGQAADINRLREENPAAAMAAENKKEILAHTRQSLGIEIQKAGRAGGRDLKGLANLPNGELVASALATEVGQRAQAWLAQEFAAGRQPEQIVLMGKITEITRELLGQEQFKVQVLPDGRAIVPGFPTDPAVAARFGSQVYQAPEVGPLLTRPGDAVTTLLVPPDQVTEARKAVDSGNEPPERFTEMARAQNMTVPEFVAEQERLTAQLNGTRPPAAPGLAQAPIRTNPVTAPIAQVSPTEAQVLMHPNTPDYRRSRVWQRVQNLRQLQQFRQDADAARTSMAGTRGLVGTGIVGVGIVGPGATPQEGTQAANAVMPLLNLIAGPESGAMGYDAANRGNAGDTSGGIKAITGKSANQLTVREVMQLQDRGQLHAFGRYQIIGSTMRNAVRDAGVSLDDKMDATTQDRLGTALLLGNSRPALRDYLLGRTDNLSAAVTDISNEWAVFKNLSGGGRYNGLAGNSASIGVGTTKDMLQQVRRNIAQTNSTPVASRAVQAAQSSVGLRRGQGLMCAQVIADIGINPPIPRQTWDGLNTGPQMANRFFSDEVGTRVHPSQFQPGDMVAYERTYGNYGPGVITHVGIYMGNGQVWDHSRSNGTQVRPITAPGGRVLYGSRLHRS
jgi:hypothetical protein